MNGRQVLSFSFLFLLVISVIPNPTQNATIAYGATQSTGIKIASTRNIASNDDVYSNGTHIWTSQPPWIKSGPSYVPYILNQTANSIQVITQSGSYLFNKNTCTLSFYGSNTTNGNPEIGSDSFTVKAELNGTTTWNNVNTINNAACQSSINQTGNDIEVIGSKVSAGNGAFKIHYIKHDGKDLKTTIEATNNNAAWTNYHLGISEKINVPTNIKLGNTTYNLANYNNITLNRNWIISHQSQLAQLTSKVNFDFTLAFQYVNGITISYSNNQASLTIDYTYNTPILSPGHTISIDPTFGYATGVDWSVADTSGGNTSPTCPTVTLAFVAQNTPYLQNTGANGVCGITAPEWNISSIPLTAKVTTTKIQLNPSGVTNPRNCDYVQMSHSPSASTASQVWTDITTGSAYVANDAGCTVAVQFTVTLGSTANADVQSHIASGKYSVGIRFNSMTRDGSNHQSIIGPNIESLQVVYVNVPLPPTLNSVNQISSTSLNVTWSSSVGATWYFENRTSPAGGTLVNVVNTTSTFHLDTGLTPGTQYQYGIQAGNATGYSAVSNKLSKYTVNVAPTALTFSNVGPTSMRLGWTNPTGNFSGFKVEKESPIGGGWSTVISNTNNSTNRYDVTGLSSNTQYNFRVSTNYATGSSDAGTSSPSTTANHYTLPASPTGLTTTQNNPNQVHLSWTDGGGNGTVSGYFIEYSLSSGSGTWLTLVSNTGNTTTTFNSNGLPTGIHSYRVSAIKVLTSNPSNVATRTVWGIFTVNAFHANGITPVYGQAIQYNSTSSNNRFTLVSGSVSIPSLANLNNFTIWNSLIGFGVGKTYNYNTTANSVLNKNTNDFNVDCPHTGVGDDIEVWTNETDGHRISTFTTPTCFSNSTVKWSTTFTANGQSGSSYNTQVYVRILNATYLNNATLKYNNTLVSTVLSSPYIITGNIPVGTGLQSKLFNWSMNLTISPGFIPVNYTVGYLSVTGTNKVTAPITFKEAAVNSSASSVTVSFPTTYVMGYTVTANNEGTTKVLTGLPVSPGPFLGTSQSVITFKNPNNDTVSIKAYDLLTKNNATFQMTLPNTAIPFVTQILAFKNGTFGTTAMIGGLDLITLIILIVAMIGLNRVNETVGAIIMIMVIGGCAYFNIIQWQTTMTAAIALIVLVIVSSTKKLPWS